jgi:hypothetical protein
MDALIRRGRDRVGTQTGSSRSGYFRLEQQLPGGLSSSHWKTRKARSFVLFTARLVFG